jgi:hypothetical protein
LHSHALSPARSQLNATASFPHQPEYARALSIPAPSSPSHSVERDEEAHGAQARTPRKQLQQPSPSQASPRHPPPPLLPPISGDDDEHAPSSPSAFTSAAVAAAESHSNHEDAQSSSSSRSPSPPDSPRDDAVPPPRAQARANLLPFLCRRIRSRSRSPSPTPARQLTAFFRFLPQAWTVEFTAPAAGARPPKALVQRLAAAQQVVFACPHRSATPHPPTPPYLPFHPLSQHIILESRQEPTVVISVVQTAIARPPSPRLFARQNILQPRPPGGCCCGR